MNAAVALNVLSDNSIAHANAEQNPDVDQTTRPETTTTTTPTTTTF